MSANYREPQLLLPNCKNLKLPGTGTSVGSGLTEDRHSLYSMDFDSGNSDYVSSGTSLFAGTSITSISISCWIKTTAGNPNAIISKDQATNTNRVFLLQLSGGNLFWQHIKPTSTATFQNLSTTYNVADGNWHHIVVTYKAGATSGIGEKKIYVDGEEKASDTTTTLSDIYNNASIPIEIGRRGDQPSGARYFNGNIDEVAIFDYALSARQIKQDIYNGTTSGKTADLNNNSNLTPPVAWYRMGD